MRLSRLWWSANLSQEMHRKFNQTDAKILQLSSKTHPKSTKIVPRSAPEAILEGGRLQNGSWEAPSYAFLVGFWHHLDDFGRHLDSSWAPRGSQNRAFWHQDAPKSRKMRSQKGCQKKLQILIGILMENVRFGCLGSSILLQFYSGFFNIHDFRKSF